jgi:hypothetical protein
MKQQELIKKISEAADLISKSSIQGGASYIILSKQVIEVIEAEERRNKRDKKIKNILK